jgi:hypothetical protein
MHSGNGVDRYYMNSQESYTSVACVELVAIRLHEISTIFPQTIKQNGNNSQII